MAQLSYYVRVTPTVDNETITVTGSLTTNPTTATYCDETCATYSSGVYSGSSTAPSSQSVQTLGPLCPMTVTEDSTAVTIPTLALLSYVKAVPVGNHVQIEWETVSEHKTAGFDIYRNDKDTGEFVRLNDKLLAGLITSPQGGQYRYLDVGAKAGETYFYKIVEIETDGTERVYGPFESTAETAQPAFKSANVASSFVATASEPFVKKPLKSAIAPESVAHATPWQTHESVRGLSRLSGQKVKITVAEDGVYYLSASDVSAFLGITLNTAKKYLASRAFLLTNQGRSVAYFVEQNNEGIFFYGKAETTIYTDANVYWLALGTGQLMGTAAVQGSERSAPEATFTETIRAEQDEFPFTAMFHDPEMDYWAWDFVIADDAKHGAKTFPITLYGVQSLADNATLKVNILGGTDASVAVDHHAIVSLNGVEAGEATWDGFALYSFTIQLSRELLKNGLNEIRVKGTLGDNVSFSHFYVDSFDLTYQRFYEAIDDSLRFRADANLIIAVTGFTNPDILLFDITDENRPIALKGYAIVEDNGEYSIQFKPQNPDAIYFAATKQSAITQTHAESYRSAGLTSRNNQADYVLIAPKALKNSTESLAKLGNSRRLLVKVVFLEDILDELNDGVYSPHAIKDFLTYVYTNWRKSPKYVLLIGKGTFDYKNRKGFGDNLMPALMIDTPYGLFPSDTRMADVINNDGVPEFAIGRLPIVNEAGVNAYLAKLNAYNNGGKVKTVVMLADNADLAGDFPVDSDKTALLVPNNHIVKKIYLNEHPLEQARNLLSEALEKGVFSVNFIGHGGLDSLSGEGLLMTDDVAFMFNTKLLPIYSLMTCVSARFDIPGYVSLSEALVSYNTSGAIAVIGPTGLSINEEATLLDQEFFKAVYTDKTPRAGDAFLKALKEYGAQGGKKYILGIYNFLGDPAVEIWSR
jgi:hypothetical protein